MFPSAGDELALKPGGLVIAAIAFLLTRTLLVSIVFPGMDESMAALLIRLLPIIIGLAIVVFGVSLAVSTHDKRYVRTVTTWYLIGSLGLLVLVGLGTVVDGMRMAAIRDSGIVANAVVGGGAGGILVGTRAARDHQQQRALGQQADQAVLLNRLLRHEVLNALTAVEGHAKLLGNREGETEQSEAAVSRNVQRIEQTIEDVGFLIRSADETAAALEPVRLDETLEQCRQRLATDEQAVEFRSSPPAITVRADEHLESLLAELVQLAAENESGDGVTLDVVVTERRAVVSVAAPGNWVSDPTREILLDGLPEYETDGLNYGASIVRLLVDQYDGELDVVETDAGMAVELTFLRTEDATPPGATHGVDTDMLVTAGVAGLAAGVVMGGVIQALSGTIAIIGGLYGVETTLIGWLTHLFHSSVFAIVFAAVAARPRFDGYTDGPTGILALAVGYALVLWVVAAGFVMRLWLTALAIPPTSPILDPVTLVGHLVWGAVLAGVIWSQVDTPIERTHAAASSSS